MKRLQTLSTQLKGILTITLLRALSGGLLSPIIALYIKQHVNTDQHVSLIIMGSYLFAFFASIYGAKIISILQKRKTMIVTLLFHAVVLILFAVESFSSHSIIFFFVLYAFLFSLLQFGISLYIDHFAQHKALGKTFGTNGMLGNVGWLAGPIIGGALANAFSFIEVFLFASLISFIALLVFIFSEPKEPPKNHLYPHQHLLKNFTAFFHKPSLRLTYFVGLIFNIVYGSLFLAPLFFTSLGADVTIIGILLGISAIPWIVLEIPIGSIADKRKNEPKLFLLGYFLLAGSLLMFGLTPLLYVAALALICISVATSFIEQTIFSFFYRLVPEKQIGYISIFMTTTSLGLFIGTLLPSFALIFVPLGTYYALLGAFVGITGITAAMKLFRYGK